MRSLPMTGATLVRMSEHDDRSPAATPFLELDRADWAALAPTAANPLSEEELVRLRGLGDSLNLREVAEVYVPLSKLLNLYAVGARRLHQSTRTFLGQDGPPTPFVIGVAGSVAVGKSTTARLLREMLARWDDTPRVELVTTDGFLYSNAELERRGLMDRKGFPESYDRRALIEFLTEVKSGAPEARAPFYSHMRYDIVPDAHVVVRRPDVVIVEGLNVLQPAATPNDVAVSDLFDFSVFVDADVENIQKWYVDRFLALRKGSFSNPHSYFNVFAHLTDDEAETTAMGYWNDINMPNLVENVMPTKHRATLVLRKGADHSVERVSLRKL